MAVFPLFVSLKGKKCVVIGAGNVAERKIETLMQFEADITVVSPQVSERIQELKWQNKVVVVKKRYSSEDLEDAFLVIGATSDRKVNEAIYRDAVKKHIFVNTIDNPELCTFIFPSVVKREDLVVGISTSGGYPALSKKLRQGIEEMIPENYGEILSTLKECRQRALETIPIEEKRKELLGRLVDELLFYGSTVTEKQLRSRIERLFEEYGDEKGY